jgi:hypothetical protein
MIFQVTITDDPWLSFAASEDKDGQAYFGQIPTSTYAAPRFGLYLLDADGQKAWLRNKDLSSELVFQEEAVQLLRGTSVAKQGITDLALWKAEYALPSTVTQSGPSTADRLLLKAPSPAMKKQWEVVSHL